jgi:hypothetical protein
MQYRITAVIDAVNMAPLIEALVPLSAKPLQVSAYTEGKPERAITRTPTPPPSQSLDDMLAPAPAHANYDPPADVRPPPLAPTKRRRFASPQGTAEELMMELLRTGPATADELREELIKVGYSKSTINNTLWVLMRDEKLELVPGRVERTFRIKGLANTSNAA